MTGQQRTREVEFGDTLEDRIGLCSRNDLRGASSILCRRERLLGAWLDVHFAHGLHLQVRCSSFREQHCVSCLQKFETTPSNDSESGERENKKIGSKSLI